MGGLNYQIEHHLFPSMPTPALRRAQVITERYCPSWASRTTRRAARLAPRGAAPPQERREPLRAGVTDSPAPCGAEGAVFAPAPPLRPHASAIATPTNAAPRPAHAATTLTAA
ncbi:fatty acid desaturase [Streptomyces sp. F001]|uniref:fatty acid desaturase n=1 Tax=Streptomyces sp. F001 TaxID=1510026 RepID=UPI001F0D6E27|nr:fatty acid desaturase [Streptomyces sp. F001]